MGRLAWLRVEGLGGAEFSLRHRLNLTDPQPCPNHHVPTKPKPAFRVGEEGIDTLHPPWPHFASFGFGVRGRMWQNGSFPKLGVPYFGILIIRILLFKVLY